MQTEEVSLCEIFYQKNEISQVLQVSISQLTTYLPETTSELISTPGRSRKSPFFQAQRLYFYFYDGRYQRTKCVVTLKPQEHTENFRHQLLFTKKDLKRLEQLNMLLVENKEN